MAKARISIGTWAYSIGPYAESPVPFPEVCEKLKALNFDGLELGGFGQHPNPDALKTKEERQKVRELWESKGMGCSGLAADLGQGGQAREEGRLAEAHGLDGRQAGERQLPGQPIA